MTMKKEILKLLAKEELTSSDVSNKLGVASTTVWPYLKVLYNSKIIERINDKKPYKYRAITPMRYLIDLYQFMSDENKCELKEITEGDIILLTKIKEMIQ